MSSKTSRRRGRRRAPPRSSFRKRERREIASSHIQKLLELSLGEAPKDPGMAARYADLAWQISTRFNVRLKEQRRYYCRRCKAFIALPGGARYRLGKGRILKVTCLKCGQTYRKTLRPGGINRSSVHKRLNSARVNSPNGH